MGGSTLNLPIASSPFPASFCLHVCILSGVALMLQRLQQYLSTCTDGFPLPPVSPPVQIAETMYTVTLAWGYSPTPLNSPLLGYNITLHSCQQPQVLALFVVTSSNETEITIDLSPGASFCVTVGGRSRMGAGNVSAVGRIMTMSAEVPPAPSLVNVSWIATGIAIVTWQVY